MLNAGSIYCENFSNSFILTEPINTISNISFFIAGTILYKLYLKQHKKDLSILSLITLVILIGVGSTIWHATHSYVGELMDVVSILLFLVLYIALFLKRVVKCPTYCTTFLVLCFVSLSFISSMIWEEEPLKTSGGYLPSVITLIIFTVISLKKKYNDLYRALITASSLIIISITVRSWDLAACSTYPTGTHFIWHILNGVVLFYTTKGLMTQTMFL